MEDDLFQRVEKLLVGKDALSGPNQLSANTKVTKVYLGELSKDKMV